MNNLPSDPYLINLLGAHGGTVPIHVIAGFPKIQEWFQYYMAFHGSDTHNKLPFTPLHLVSEAMKSSLSVHLMPNGVLVPDSWKTLEAMRQRQHASPVPTSVSSQSSDPSPVPQPQFFHHLNNHGGYDMRSENTAMTNNPHHHQQAPYWQQQQQQQAPPPSMGYSAAAEQAYYPEQTQYGYVAHMEPYEMPPQGFQPLMGNYVGYDNNNNNVPPMQGMAATTEYYQAPDPEKQQQQPPQHSYPQQKVATTQTAPEPSASFFSTETSTVVAAAKDGASVGSAAPSWHGKQGGTRNWTKSKGRGKKGFKNKDYRNGDGFKNKDSSKGEKKQRERKKSNSPVLKEADFPPLQAASSTVAAKPTPATESGSGNNEDSPSKKKNSWKKKNKKIKASGIDNVDNVAQEGSTTKV